MRLWANKGNPPLNKSLAKLKELFLIKDAAIKSNKQYFHDTL